MTEDTLNPSMADTDATNEQARKQALKAEMVKRGLTTHPRFGEQRMRDMIAEHDAKLAAPTAATTPAEKAAEPVDDVAALKQQLAEAQAALAAKSAEPPAFTGPAGMTTTARISLPGDLAREEAEKKMLMERCMQVGIAHLIPARANPNAIRDILGRHMAERAQKQATEEATARLRAKGPVEEFVALRVLPLGDKKISNGIHIPGFGDETYQYGDIIAEVPLATAKAHVANGYGEIVRT